MKTFCKIWDVHIENPMYIEILTSNKQLDFIKRLLLFNNITYSEKKTEYSNNIIVRSHIETKKQYNRVITNIKEYDDRFNIKTNCDYELNQYLKILNEKESII